MRPLQGWDRSGQAESGDTGPYLFLALEDLGPKLWMWTCHRLTTPRPLPHGLVEGGRGGCSKVEGRRRDAEQRDRREMWQVQGAEAGSEASGSRRATGRKRPRGQALRQWGGPRTWAAPCGQPAPTASSAVSSAPAGTSRSTAYTRASCQTPQTCSWGGRAAVGRDGVSSGPQPGARLPHSSLSPALGVTLWPEVKVDLWR